MRLVASTAALLLASAGSGQVVPTKSATDPRLQTVDYRRDQVVILESEPGYQLTVELAPDEQIRNVVLGDSAGWQVLTNQAGNRLFVQPLRIERDTNMTVETNARSYAFDLVTGRSDPATIPYVVRFRYPGAESASTPLMPSILPPTFAPKTRYRISGFKALRPTQVTDDGVHTYIDWPASAALPATYTVDALGRESLANGNMRSGQYVIDAVAPRLLFRIDRRKAQADRVLARSTKRPS